MVGQLINLTVTWLDIVFVVGVVRQLMHTPCQSHWDVVCRILRYLKGGPGKGIFYTPSKDMQIIGYFDPDWVGS